MKVLYIVSGGERAYGSEIVAMQIMTKLSRNKDIEYSVVTNKNSILTEFCKKSDIPIVEVPMRFFVYHPCANRLLDSIKRIGRLVQAELLLKKSIISVEGKFNIKSFDIIHTNLSRDLLGAVLSEKYKTPHIWHIQELFKAHYGVVPLRKKQISYMNHHASSFIAISNKVKESWSSAGLNDSKITVVHNGGFLDNIMPRKQREDSALKIIMVGEICEAKGQEYVIRALGQVDSILKHNIYLDMYGHGKQQYMDKLKEESIKQDTKIRFLGYRNDLKTKLSDYDIAVNCSKGEGFGLTTVEFMAAGLLILAADTGANSEIIRDKVTGLLFDYEKKIEMIKYFIERIMMDRTIINQIGGVARKEVFDKFNSAAFENRIFEVYENALCDEMKK